MKIIQWQKVEKDEKIVLNSCFHLRNHQHQNLFYPKSIIRKSSKSSNPAQIYVLLLICFSFRLNLRKLIMATSHLIIYPFLSSVETWVVFVSTDVYSCLCMNLLVRYCGLRNCSEILLFEINFLICLFTRVQLYVSQSVRDN